MRFFAGETTRVLALSLAFTAEKIKNLKLAPLEAILMKPLSAAPPPLQGMMLHLQKYDLNVRHKPGKEMPVAETLSRLHLKHTHDTHKSFDAQVHMVMANLPFSDTKILELKSKTRDEPALQQLIRIVNRLDVTSRLFPHRTPIMGSHPAY